MSAPTANPDGLDKAAWRRRLLAARATVPDEVRTAEATALVRHVAALRGLVCAYRPVGTEPGSTDLLDRLVATGCTVLLPVTGSPAALDWARYVPGTRFEPGALGIPEPTGPRLGPAAVGEADAVLVPALAVDHRGVRLGRGAGWYDRSLALARPGATIAVIRDDEYVPELPAEPHDLPVSAVLTPARGIFPVGK